MFIRYVRENKKITTLFILITVGAFAIVPIMRLWELYSAEKFVFAEVGGKKIDPHRYKELYEGAFFRALYGEKREHAEATYYAHMRVWHLLTEQKSIEDPLEHMGICVLEDERTSLVLDNKALKKQLGNPETGEEATDEEVIERLKSIADTDQGSERLRQQEEEMAYYRSVDKYEQLILQGYRDTAADKAIEEALSQKKVLVKAIFVPYTAVLKEEATEQEKEAYLKEHQRAYEWKNEREVLYIVAPIYPSDRDWDTLNDKVKETTKRLEREKLDPLAFAKRYSDNREEVSVEWTEDEIPEAIKNQLKRNKQGHFKVSSKIIVVELEKPHTHVLYRLVKVGRNLRLQKKYTFARIEKKIVISEDTRSDTYRDTAKFAEAIKKKKIKTFEAFKKEAEEHGFQARKKKVTQKEAQRVGLPHDYTPAQIARWTYKEKKVHKVSDPILVGDKHYFVAMLLQKHEKGPKVMDEVAEEIERAVIQENKKKEILKQLSPLVGTKNIVKKVKEMYPHHSFVTKKKAITQATSSLHDSLGACNQGIGQILTLSAGEQCIVAGEHGVIIAICLETESKEIDPAEAKKERKKEKEKFFRKLKKAYLFLIEKKEQLIDERYKYLE